jgi:2-polyprenyl-3-methyl-5-hydroxy-6-metoxy-1,4-benzoquinol methylase
MGGNVSYQEGLELCAKGEFQAAADVLRAALRDEETSDRWNDWATLEVACNRMANAEGGYRRALELDPGHGQAAANLGVLLASLDRKTEALKYLEQGAAKVDETQRVILLDLLLDLRQKHAGSPPTALVSTEEGRAGDPARQSADEPSSGLVPPHLGGHLGVTHLDEGALEHLIHAFQIRSMIDIGCGPGGMVQLARAKGLDAVGVDGDPLVPDLSGLPDENLVIHDFTRGPLMLDRKFDLAWSVEFLEHVEERFQSHYMDLFQHARYVFLTAAPPGKPGHHHVNCRDAAYWVEVFSRYGFAYDRETTEALKGASTMEREFVREMGMFFARCDPNAPESIQPEPAGQEQILHHALRLVKPGDRVLDVGAGRCKASLSFAKAGCRVTAIGLHFDRYWDERRRQELTTWNVHLHEGHFEDFTDLGKFDVVWASHVLEHQRNPGAFLDHCLELLQPGGWLFLVVPPLKTQVVSGHLTVWFPGLLLYNLVMAGLDCSRIHMCKLGYNVAACVRNVRRPLPELTSSLGDIELLAGRFPAGMRHQGFEGDFDEIHWPPSV